MRSLNHSSRAIFHVKSFFGALLERAIVRFGPTGVEVDVNDDSLERWYVRHYRYDPERNEVRHVFLKAFSNKKAMIKYYVEKNNELVARRKIENVPAHEHISGGRYEPGYHANVRARRDRSSGHGGNISWYEPKR